MNYNEVIEYLLSTPKFTKKTKLSNTNVLLDKLNNPEKNLKIIHVAGTNGKGSVSGFINNVLIEAGYTTGLFTSPHLVKVNERIRLNNVLIDDKSLTKAFNKIKNIIDNMIEEGFEHPAFFELIFAIALVIFREMKVEYAVIETGLGGRLDATNAVNGQILTVLTSIGLDHVKILGDTIEEIVKEKAAIIRTDVPVVYYARNKQISEIIERKIKDKGTVGFPLYESNYKFINFCNDYIDFSLDNEYYVYRDVKIKSKAMYQIQNASLAILGLNILKNQGVNITDEIILRGIKDTRIDGRMEEVAGGIILDGAHNEDGIREFINTVNAFYTVEDKSLIFSAVDDKEYVSMIHLLCTNIEFKNIILTKINNSRGVDIKHMCKAFKGYCQNIIEANTVQEAYNMGKRLALDYQMVFCTGSLYLVGEIKEIIGGLEDD